MQAEASSLWGNPKQPVPWHIIPDELWGHVLEGLNLITTLSFGCVCSKFQLLSNKYCIQRYSHLSQISSTFLRKFSETITRLKVNDNNALASLSMLTNLQRLKISVAFDLKMLTSMTKLRKLHISGFTPKPRDFTLLQKLHVTSLTVSKLPTTTPLRNLKSLRVLLDSDANIAPWTHLDKLRMNTHYGLRDGVLSSFTNLKSLHLEVCDSCSKTTSSLQLLTKLTSATLLQRAIDWSLDIPTPLASLRKLDAGFHTLSCLSELTQLISLRYLSKTNTCHISALTRLTELWSPLSESDENISLPLLERLVISRDGTLSTVANFPQLSFLELNSNSFSDSGLSTLTSLTCLKVKRPSQGLTCCSLSRLTTLSKLYNTAFPTSDACVMALPKLTRLVRLRGNYLHFDIQEAQVSFGEYGQRVKEEREFQFARQ